MSVSCDVGSSAIEVIYESHVTAVGELAEEFFAAGILVLFGDGAPEELAEFAVIHQPNSVQGAVEVGDDIDVDGVVLHVTAVGAVANENLRNLGHLSLKRNGESIAALQGDVCCDQGPMQAMRVGTTIRILRGGKERRT
jgi:glucitol/sorbitol PTS system EIIA component